MAGPSDFYEGRRTQFADIGGLVGMGVGALVAAMTAWQPLATGFRTGALERAFALFIGAVIGAGALGGLLGLRGGRWFADRWERRHRAARAPLPPDEPAPVPATPTAPPVALGVLSMRALSTEAQRALAIVQPPPADASVAWGAWDGPRLVAVAWVRHDGSVARTSTAEGYHPDRIGDAVHDAARGITAGC